jgi:hypothetical protein
VRCSGRALARDHFPVGTFPGLTKTAVSGAPGDESRTYCRRCAARAAPQAASGSAAAPPARGGGRAAAARAGGVRSLADIAKSDEDTDEDDHNEYYAGGEKSGQARALAPQ